jgi:N,N'-diacetyllegionaminate synthase
MKLHPCRPGETPAACYIIAEVGINHNGDVDLARELVDVAVEAGADAVKFQNFRTEDFLSDRSLTYTYGLAGREIAESQWDMFKRCELYGDRLALVADHCRARGIDFAATPTSPEGIAECLRLGAAFLKNGSDYITNLPLIRAMAKTGQMTILSTGMATVADIDDAVRAFRESGGSNLVLLHCVSLYPAPPESLDLRRIPVLAAAFDCPVGFSDHSVGVAAAIAAVALGAVVLERHITLNKDMSGPDHRFSADPAELRAIIAGVRAAEAALGSARLGLNQVEEEARALHRLSCVAARTLPVGTVLTPPDVALRRPGSGLPPKAAPWLIGRRLGREVAAGHVLGPEDFV